MPINVNLAEVEIADIVDPHFYVLSQIAPERAHFVVVNNGGPFTLEELRICTYSLSNMYEWRGVLPVVCQVSLDFSYIFDFSFTDV
jgi:hypothetical protein